MSAALKHPWLRSPVFWLTLLAVAVGLTLIACGGGGGGGSSDGTSSSGDTTPTAEAATSKAWDPASQATPVVDVAGGGSFVAVTQEGDFSSNNYGSVFRSGDGSSWSEVALPGGPLLRGPQVAHDGSRYLIVAKEQAWVSTDGQDWQASPEFQSVCSANFEPDILFAHPEAGEGFLVYDNHEDDLCRTSGGFTWEFVDTRGQPNDVRGVVGSGGSYQLVSHDGTFYATTDFQEYTVGQSCDLGTHSTDPVVTDALSQGGYTYLTTNVGEVIRTDDNGTSCTTVDSSSDNLRAIAYDSGLDFAAVGNGGRVLTSSDGSTWSAATVTDDPGRDLTAITVHSGSAVAVGDHFTYLADSGSGWAVQETGAGPADPAGVAYSQDLGGFVAVDATAGYTTTDVGDTWDEVFTVTESHYNDPMRTVATRAGGTALAAGDVVTRLTTDVAAPWGDSDAEPVLGLRHTNRIKHDGSRFVGVGDHGLVFTSGDFASFQVLPTVPDGDLQALATDGTDLLAGGENALVLCQDLATPSACDDLGEGLNNTGSSEVTALATDGGGTWVAVMDGNEVFRSTNRGEGWTSVLGSGVGTLMDVTWSGSAFVVVGQDGFWRSTDGTSWSDPQSGATPYLYGVATGGGTLAAIADQAVWTSSDHGQSWTEHGAPTAGYRRIIHDPGSGDFIAHTTTDSNPGYAVWDGSGWEEHRGTGHGRWQAMVASAGQGIVGFQEKDPGDATYNGPGLRAAIPTPGTEEVKAELLGGIRLLANNDAEGSGDQWVALDGYTLEPNPYGAGTVGNLDRRHFAHSGNGVTWTIETMDYPAGFRVTDLIHGGGQFVALASRSSTATTSAAYRVLTNSDPASQAWTTHTDPGLLRSDLYATPRFWELAYGGGTYVALGEQYAATASDPAAWQVHPDSYGAFGYNGIDGLRRVRDVIYDGSGFVAVGTQESVWGSGDFYEARFWTSTDGVDWQAFDPGLGRDWVGVAHDPANNRYLTIDSAGRTARFTGSLN